MMDDCILNVNYFSNDHYDIGLQQGHAVSTLLQDVCKQMAKLEAVKILKPKLLPASLFLFLTKKKAAKIFKKDIYTYYPRQAQRLEGIAKGAGIDLPTLFLIQAAELLINIRKSDYHIQACTSLGFGPRKIKTDEAIIGKNFDYPNEFLPYQLTCKVEPHVGYRTLGCTMAPLPGVLDGMNEHGLTVTYNLAYTIDEPKYFVPISIVLQEMLETCKTTEDAINFLISAKRAGDALLTLADAKDELKAVEISSNHFAIAEMTNDYVLNTNHFSTREMKKIEIPHNAVYSGNAPKSIHGMNVHESSMQRYLRAKELIENKKIIKEDEIVKILRDHGTDNIPSMFTICRHEALSSTLRSVIFYPKRKTMKVLYGNPCENKYVDFSF